MSAIKSEIKTESEEDTKIEFKRKKRTHLRSRVKQEDDEEDEELSVKLGQTKELQSLRKRTNGINITQALGDNMPVEDTSLKDPFKMNMGGMVNMQALKTGKLEEIDNGIGTQFSVETNKRDEDDEMMKYIEHQLAKRKGNQDDEEDKLAVLKEMKKSAYLSPEEAALRAVPTHLRESSATKSEEMLSNQMLSGIPEVDLGIESKIKNIEATEEAKSRLLYNQNLKKDAPSHFVPTNMAVNFVQHNRLNVGRVERAEKKRKAETSKVEEKGSLKKDEKATDDYHYEKFRKQFKRH